MNHPKYHTPTRRELQVLANKQSLIIDDLRTTIARITTELEQLRKEQ